MSERMTKADWYKRFPRIEQANYNATTDGFWEVEITNEAGCILDWWEADKPLRYCEVGVSQAKSACILLHRLPLLIYTGVDNWLGWDEDRQITYHNLGHFPGRWKIIDCDSTAAAAQCQDGEFDVVFIDASKAEGKYCADCIAWWPKVKPGGSIMGHDICHPLWINRDKVDRVKEEVDTFSVRIGNLPYTVNEKRNTWRMVKPA